MGNPDRLRRLEGIGVVWDRMADRLDRKLLFDHGLRNEESNDGLNTREITKDDISQLICTLTTREQDIIRMRFGLDGGERKTLETIGNKYSVSRERIRQLEEGALKKLR